MPRNKRPDHLARDGGQSYCLICGSLRNLFSKLQRSFEQCFNICHRPKQFHRLIRKRQKALARIEVFSALILGVHDHRKGRDLAAHSPIERIREKKAAVSFSLAALIYSKTPQQGRRDQGVAWQLSDSGLRQLRKPHRRRRERIISGNTVVFQHKDEWRCHLLSGVLSSLRLKISVEGLHTTCEP